MNNPERYELIKNSIQKAIDSGVQLIFGDWGVSSKPGETYSFSDYITLPNSKCGCAISCTLAANSVPVVSNVFGETDRFFNDAAQFLQTTTGWVEDFVRGFDGEIFVPKNFDALEMGQQIRKDFSDQIMSSDDFLTQFEEYDDFEEYEDTLPN